MESDLQAAAEFFAANLTDTPAEPEKEQAEEAAPEQEEDQAPAPESEGENEDQSTDESPDEEAPELITVKIDGKEVQVSLDELKNGYQRQADYTRKTMEAAETRKAADAERQKTLEERQHYAQNLQNQQALLTAVLQEQAQTNWQELIDSDPVEYLKQQHLFQQRQAALQKLHADAAQFRQTVETEQKAEAEKFIREQQDHLLAKLPEWKDEAKAKAGKAELRDYLKNEAFSDDELNQLADHRHVILARKAMLYDRMMAEAKTAAKKIQNVPQKVLRPSNGANQSIDKRTRDFQHLKKTGTVEAAAAVFSNLL